MQSLGQGAGLDVDCPTSAKYNDNASPKWNQSWHILWYLVFLTMRSMQYSHLLETFPTQSLKLHFSHTSIILNDIPMFWKVYKHLCLDSWGHWLQCHHKKRNQKIHMINEVLWEEKPVKHQIALVSQVLFCLCVFLQHHSRTLIDDPQDLKQSVVYVCPYKEAHWTNVCKPLALGEKHFTFCIVQANRTTAETLTEATFVK